MYLLYNIVYVTLYFFTAVSGCIWNHANIWDGKKKKKIAAFIH